MDPLSRHPTLTKATRVLGIVLSSLCVVVLAAATLLAWYPVGANPATGGRGVALFFTLLLVACLAMLWRALFVRATPHSPRTLVIVSWGLLVLGTCGLVAALGGLAYGFGDLSDLALMLTGALGCLSTGIAMRRRYGT